MCGIAGIVWSRPGTSSASTARAILDQLGHRGPDDSGCLVLCRNAVESSREVRDVAEAEVLFLHRRLAIIDPTPAGWQPMTSRDGRYSLVYNGEIYNYVELRDELERLGYTDFVSNCDTEVLLKGFEVWGIDVLPRLVGMFAFSVLDLQSRTLTLARDFAGIKPLYHSRWSHGWAFASELKALLELPGVSRVAHPERVYDYLRHGHSDHGRSTMLRDVFQVPAGSILTVRIDDLDMSSGQFWRPASETRYEGTFDAAAEHLRSLFLDSVRLHLRSDVPLGTALSGGIDSSSILCCIRHLRPDAELHAFSYVAEDPALSEERWVRIAADRAGAHVHPVRSSAGQLRDELKMLMHAQDFPFTSTSMYAQYRVFRAAHDAGIKVMLDGQGADEMLGGYRMHQAARLASLIRRGRFGRSVGFLNHLRDDSTEGAALHLMRAAGMLVPRGVQSMIPGRWSTGASAAWLNLDWFRGRGVRLTPHPWHAGESLVLKEMLRRSFVETSLPMLLRYEDRNSMASSIESRVPFLTPTLVDFTFSLPEEYLIDSQARTKAVFRRAMRGIVPDEILDRRDKIGFVTPQTAWLLQLDSWVDSMVAGEAARRLPVFRHDRLLDAWVGARSRGRARDYRNVWRWLNFIYWAHETDIVFE